MGKPSNLNLRGVTPQAAQDSAPEISLTQEKAENSVSTPVVPYLSEGAPTAVPTESTTDTNTAAILKALQQVQTDLSESKKEIAQMREFNSQLAVFENQKKSQERYNGPWKFSYKLYEGQPICSLRMTRNNVLLNANTGRYVANQTIEMTFANGEKKEVDYDIFYQIYTRSEKIFVKEVIERDGKKLYKFEVNGEEFIVDNTAIN